MRADQLHVWPETIELKLNPKSAHTSYGEETIVGMALSVPRAFFRDVPTLENSKGEPLPPEAIADELDVFEFLHKDAVVPGKPFFQLLYDDDGTLVYFRVRPPLFERDEEPTIEPEFVRTPLDCRWRAPEFLDQRNRTKTLANHHPVDWWLVDR